MLIRNAFLSIVTIIFLSFIYSRVSAQSIRNRLKLGMEPEFFRIAVTTNTPEETDANTTKEYLAFGIMGSTFGLDVAYGLTQNVVIEVLSTFEMESLQLEEEEKIDT